MLIIFLAPIFIILLQSCHNHHHHNSKGPFLSAFSQWLNKELLMNNLPCKDMIKNSKPSLWGKKSIVFEDYKKVVFLISFSFPFNHLESKVRKFPADIPGDPSLPGRVKRSRPADHENLFFLFKTIFLLFKTVFLLFMTFFTKIFLLFLLIFFFAWISDLFLGRSRRSLRTCPASPTPSPSRWPSSGGCRTSWPSPWTCGPPRTCAPPLWTWWNILQIFLFIFSMPEWCKSSSTLIWCI